MNEKKLRYSNVELFDIIKNKTDKKEVKKAESELESRNLTEEQKVKLESEYYKYKKYKENRKSEPLTDEEWLTFFIFPFFTPTPRSRLEKDHYSESEMERFKKYGFEKKAEQAEKVKIYGTFFWLIAITITGIIIAEFR